MESSSSVYMCFPCYQEFDTLDEVLKHQLTCNAEATELGPNTSGFASITVQQAQVTATAWWSHRHCMPYVFVLKCSCITYGTPVWGHRADIQHSGATEASVTRQPNERYESCWVEFFQMTIRFPSFCTNCRHAIQLLIHVNIFMRMDEIRF